MLNRVALIFMKIYAINEESNITAGQQGPILPSRSVFSLLTNKEEAGYPSKANGESASLPETQFKASDPHSLEKLSSLKRAKMNG